MLERLETAGAALAALALRRPGLAAIVFGLLAACAYPPLHLWPLGLAGLAGFVWLAYSAPDWRSAALRGWLFGWAHLTLANNWIATAFTHQAKMPEALGWAAVPLLCVYLAVYPMLAVLAAHLLARKRPLWAYGFVLAGGWIVTEWLRGWVFTGYPWPPLGLMLVGDWQARGVATFLPWLGTYALSGLVLVLATGLLANVIIRRWFAVVGPLAAIGFAMHVPVTPGPDSPLRYTLVQPYLPQSELNDPAKFEEQFARIVRLTARGRDQSRIVLWPESAVPDYLEDGYPDRYYFQMTAAGDPVFARRRIGAAIGPKSTLLTGVVNLNIGKNASGVPAAVSARNSVMALDGAGRILAGYDKAHLVPYGEYLPLRPFLEPIGFERLVAGSIDYIPGPGPRTLDLEKLGSGHGKVGVQICYEIVFSGEVVDRANRPDFIFNPSNDGWFGAWGSPQFVGQARMRAIEEGLPVLRSTTTGISAVIDANGVVRQAIGTGKAGMVDGFVPAAKPPTLFARLGHALTLAWAALFILLGLGLPRLLALRRARG